MSTTTPKILARRLQRSAPLFAALADEGRLALVARLSGGERLSIAQLSQHATITRQAVTKHLGVLERAGLVRSTRRGRENLFQLDAKPLQEASASLDFISRQWDDALQRLKAFVEQ